MQAGSTGLQRGAASLRARPEGQPASTGRRLGHVAALDGLRGVAVLAVLGFHFAPFGQFSGGWLGVDLFFVLSGFLITSLLLDELDRTGRVRLGRFHLRRALRLQPALWLFLGTWTVALVAFGHDAWFSAVPGFPVSSRAVTPVGEGLTGVAGALTECYNWLIVTGVPVPPLGHLWSLSVEEQFYLAWPPVLVLLGWWSRHRPVATRRRLMLGVALGLAVASATWTIVAWHRGATDLRIYFATDTRAQAFLLGAVAAVLWRWGKLDGLVRHRLWPALAGLALATLAVVFLLLGGRTGWRDGGGFTVVDLAAAVVTVAAVSGRPLRATALLRRPWLMHLGRRSYAIYIWSYLFATWLHPLGALGVAPGVVAALVAAEVSWHLVERRALALKARMSRLEGPTHHDRVPAAVP